MNCFYTGESLKRAKDIMNCVRQYIPQDVNCSAEELLAFTESVNKRNNIINLESYIKKSINSLREGGYAAAGKRMKRQFRNNVL